LSHAHYILFPILTPPPPSSTLFPYTTLFRSQPDQNAPPHQGQFHRTLISAKRQASGSGDREEAGDVYLRAQRRVVLPRYERQVRSEEHTSELQSRGHLVCRLLLEKKKVTENH